jgi:6-phosphogluconolactonase/glucosamine-6-phosphate isomerase/deaminase
MEIITNSDIGKITSLTGQRICDILSTYQGENVLLLLSGGSVLETLKYIKVDNLGPNITIAMLDERFSRDKKINNFLQFSQSSFYKKAISKSCHLLGSIPNENELLNDFGQRLEKNILNWFNNNKKGRVIGVFGIGEDGHTAGIMPYPENKERFNYLFNNPTKMMVGYEINKSQEMYKHNERITITIPFIKKYIKCCIIYAIGENKRKAIQSVLNEDDIYKTPASILNNIKETFLFTDINPK